LTDIKSFLKWRKIRFFQCDTHGATKWWTPHAHKISFHESHHKLTNMPKSVNLNGRDLDNLDSKYSNKYEKKFIATYKLMVIQNSYNFYS
jgi:hypothetical protein